MMATVQSNVKDPVQDKETTGTAKVIFYIFYIFAFGAPAYGAPSQRIFNL